MSASNEAEVPRDHAGQRVLVLSPPGAARDLCVELEGAGYVVRGVRDPADGAEIAASWVPNIVLCTEGLEPERMTEVLLADQPGTPRLTALVVSEYTSESLALALRYRVHTVLERASVVDDLRRVMALGMMPGEHDAAAPDAAPVGSLVGTSAEMSAVWKLVSRTAPLATTVLVVGETGCGKESVARALHQLSPRRSGPFVAVNCAALPDTLLESELFGHERGAFTGAAARHTGRFELAQGGTLLLDEVGELPALLQAKLLRVLQERTFERVGGTKPIEVDVRVIAATNRDLEAEVQRGTFRADLLYRLNALVLRVPALRQRKADILPMWDHFLAEALAESGQVQPVVTALEAKRLLLAYGWPGNVRELQNVARRSAALVRGEVLTPEHLPTELVARTEPATTLGAVELAGFTLREVERAAILGTLETVGDVKAAARMLGISVRKLYYRLKQYRRELARGTASPTEAPGGQASAPTSGPSRPPPRVVLAEDDDDVRVSLAELLRSEGYEVVEVTSGIDVLQHLTVTAEQAGRRPSEVLITDVRMPGLNGMRLLEGLRAMGATIPVVVITAFADDETRRQAARLGASAVLDKPIDVETLIATLRRAEAA
jgi:DNA-binding NtrC family response regulator